MAKKLYLDVCTYCRPFDNQEEMRIRLETDAYYLILYGIEKGIYLPIISPIHIAEIKDSTDLQERLEIISLFNTIKVKFSYISEEIKARAEELYLLRFGVADSAHVAFAEATADVFITCDDKLLKKCRKEKIAIPALNPVEFAIEENLK